MGTLKGFPNPRPLGTYLPPCHPLAALGLAATHHPLASPFGDFGTCTSPTYPRSLRSRPRAWPRRDAALAANPPGSLRVWLARTAIDLVQLMNHAG